jgi:hypothetical protein
VEAITDLQLGLALYRLADKLHNLQQRPLWHGGPAPINARLLLQAVTDTDTVEGFGQRLRDMRRDGTRHLLQPMDNALRAALAKHLGGEIGLNFGTGDLYTAEQVRAVAAKYAPATARPAAPEPCDWADDAELDRQLAEADADAQAFVDLHGPLPEDRTIPIDHGRSPARRGVPHHRPIDDVLEDL